MVSLKSRKKKQLIKESVSSNTWEQFDDEAEPYAYYNESHNCIIANKDKFDNAEEAKQYVESVLNDIGARVGIEYAPDDGDPEVEYVFHIAGEGNALYDGLLKFVNDNWNDFFKEEDTEFEDGVEGLHDDYLRVEIYDGWISVYLGHTGEELFGGYPEEIKEFGPEGFAKYLATRL